MKKFYMISLLTALMMGTSAMAQVEIPRPNTPAGAPENGKTYVFVSATSPTRHYSNLTWWDNAVYLTQDVDFEFTAVDNEDGTWSFTRQEGETTYYMITRYNDGNVRWNSEEQTKWYVEPGDFDDFVRLKAGEGNGEPQQLYYVHLNKNADFMIVSCPGYPYYPDYELVENPDPDGEEEYLSDETGRFLMADHTSENWGFIAKEDWPLFVTLYQAYEKLVQLQETADDGEVEITSGNYATLNAALDLYNGGNVTEENANTIVAMIDAKAALYNVIMEAYDLENIDLTMEAAINQALNDYENLTETSDVNAATETLQQAIANFKEGAGDYTGYVQNPSFEDLSSQNGSATDGVAGAPTGWNVYINGTQVTTADEVRTAGINAWHGINADSEGEGKDGNYSFGLWNGGVPNYEISQRIEGLECGTYTVSAGLMVGANGSGSRRTTQRIFGNFNACYFASEYEYDKSLLDECEVQEFAGLYEPVTDRELQPITVHAYVYDGTLTFGLRTDANIAAALRETNNGAGGDGWFKLDNFHIHKEGYIGADAANVANMFLDYFKAYQNEDMESSLTTEIQNLVKTYTAKNADDPQEDINAMIISLNANMELLDRVKASVDAYQRLREAIDNGYDQLVEYAYNVGADEFEMMLEEADNGYEQGEYNVEQVNEVIENLRAKLEEVILAGLAVGDYLDVIKNPSFEDLSAQNNASSSGAVNPPVGWTLKLNGTVVTSASEYAAACGGNLAWCAINNGDPINEVDELGQTWTTQYTDGTHLWGIWNSVIPEVELSQTIEGLPAGTYTLSCDMVVQHDWSGYCVTTQRIFANGFIQMYSTEETYAEGLNETEDMAAAKKMDEWHPDAEYSYMNYAGWQSDTEVSGGSTSCPYPMALTFGVDESGVAYIGFRTNNVAPDGTVQPHQGAGWFKLDNFRLLYESTDIPVGISTQEISGQGTQIQSRQYFTADGRQIAQPQRGITIVRNVMSDGSVKAVKVIK